MLVVITGPSGVGKTTIIKSLMKADSGLKYSVSFTTRQPRPREVNGVDYNFVSHKEFQEKIRKGEFAEWSEVYGKYYGRLKSDLEGLARNNDVLVGIDIQGAMKLQEKYPEGIFIFILPKSKSALESQLRGRGADDEASIRTRLDAAIQEIEKSGNFDYNVINDRVSEAVKKVQSIITAEKCRVRSKKREV